VSESLARIIRSKLEDGTLPLENPAKVLTVPGAGGGCTACERPILSSQTEYEPEYDDRRDRIRLHAGCYSVWEEERRRHSSR
jgi:hypothetical protein